MINEQIIYAIASMFGLTLLSALLWFMLRYAEE